VAREVGMAKDAAEALFYDLGIDVPWNNNNGSSNNGSSNNGSSNNGSSNNGSSNNGSSNNGSSNNRNTTILLVASNLGPYLNQLKQMLVTGVASRWLDMVSPRDLYWDRKGTSELLSIEAELLQKYKVLHSMHYIAPKPNILVVVPSDPLSAYEDAGYGSWLQDYYNPLHYFDAVFVLSPVESAVQGERQAHGMWVIPLSPSAPSIEFRNIVQRIGASCIRAYGGYWPVDLAVQGALGTGVPVVVSVHDTNPKLVHIDSLKQATQVWPVSHAVARMLSNSFNVSFSRMRMFSNRVDLNVFQPQNLPLVPSPLVEERINDRTQETNRLLVLEETAKRVAKVHELKQKYPGRHRLLFVGRRNEQKNWDTVMRGLHVLGTEYVCLFIGRGDRTPMMKYAAQWNVTAQVHLIDTVQSEELRYYMWMADVFVVPSRWEGFGIVFIEALACGSVVITSNIEPMNEYIEHERSGLLLNEIEDEMALGALIVRGVGESALRERLQRNGPLVAERFSKESVDRWEVSLYRMVV
jgi:glycosyltransferase involved in cell wall biosynthesis